MPATITNDFVFGDQDQSGNVHSIDLAPMNKESVDTKMVVTLFGKDGGTWTPISVQNPNANPDFQIDTVHWIDDADHRQSVRGDVALERSLEHAGRGEHCSRGRRASRSRDSASTRARSALIPIAKLYDTGNSRPLPFATDFTLDLPQYQAYGLGRGATG